MVNLWTIYGLSTDNGYGWWLNPTPLVNYGKILWKIWLMWVSPWFTRNPSHPRPSPQWPRSGASRPPAAAWAPSPARAEADPSSLGCGGRKPWKMTIENHGKSWKIIENRGKSMENISINRGKPWKIMENPMILHVYELTMNSFHGYWWHQNKYIWRYNIIPSNSDTFDISKIPKP